MILKEKIHPVHYVIGALTLVLFWKWDLVAGVLCMMTSALSDIAMILRHNRK